MNELNITDAIASGNLDVMRAVLYRCPVNWNAYADRLRACAETAEATELTAPADPGRLRATRARLIRESALIGQAIDEATAADIAELSERVIDAMQAQQAAEIEAAFTEARRLIDLHGQDDHRAMRAIIHAVNLRDPGFMDRSLNAGSRCRRPRIAQRTARHFSAWRPSPTRWAPTLTTWRRSPPRWRTRA